MGAASFNYFVFKVICIVFFLNEGLGTAKLNLVQCLLQCHHPRVSYKVKIRLSILIFWDTLPIIVCCLSEVVSLGSLWMFLATTNNLKYTPLTSQYQVGCSIGEILSKQAIHSLEQLSNVVVCGHGIYTERNFETCCFSQHQLIVTRQTTTIIIRRTTK